MFGPIWSILESKLRKSENVTFLDLLKAKNQKKTNDGKYENFCDRRTSEVKDDDGHRKKEMSRQMDASMSILIWTSMDGRYWLHKDS